MSVRPWHAGDLTVYTDRVGQDISCEYTIVSGFSFRSSEENAIGANYKNLFKSDLVGNTRRDVLIFLKKTVFLFAFAAGA